MKILCVFGQHNYGDPTRGEGYEYANFIPALQKLGHEILFFESWNRTCYRNFRELNEALLHTVEENRPDVIFSVMFTYEIWKETWEILRDAGIAATINWTTDDSWKYAQSSRFLAPAFHAFTTTYPSVHGKYHYDGISNVMLTQWAASGVNLQPPLPADQCTYPVSFIGTAHGNRRVWIDSLHQKRVDVACFGHGWPNGPIGAREIPQIIQKSVISLNFANAERSWGGIGPRQTNQIKARVFEVPGAGGFLFTEWADGLDQYYIPGKEIAVFENITGLAEKIHYYLEHLNERNIIARAGHERTRVEHTYERRLAEVLDFAFYQRERFFSQRNLSQTGQIDWARFENAARRHRADRKLLLFKQLLTTACSAIWGSTRGPRAARRLVFELSWRIAGAHTYSAAGLPGRMFYL
jgi:spore maturation protein CgeB